MTALIAAETAVLVLLAIVVGGLLRSHAAILRRLHELDGGETGGSLAPRTVAPPTSVREPELLRTAHDISGVGVDEDAVAVTTVGVEHDTVLAFLSSGCSTCQQFWSDFAQPGAVQLPGSTRLVVVTQGDDYESPAAVAQLRPDGVDVVMSTQAWKDYQVPGSPYVIAVDGPTGRIKGEGTGLSWEQVAKLLAESTGDLGYVVPDARRATKPRADVDRELQADRELLAAGILPGDSSLYVPEPVER